MTLIPWRELDDRPSGSVGDVLPAVRDIGRGLRAGYCEVVPRVPGLRDTFFHRTVGGAICQNTDHPQANIGGQCPQEYRVSASILGYTPQLLPLQSMVPQSNPPRIWGPILDSRVVPSGSATSRWNVQVLAYGRETAMPSSQPDWVTIGSSSTGFSQSLPAAIQNVIAVPEPGNSDDCYIEPVIPPGEIVQPGQVGFEINLNPTFDITIAPIIAPVVILPPIIAPRFQIDMGDDTFIDVEFTLEGIQINDSSTTNITNLGDTVITQVNNNTNQQINNLNQDISQAITNNNQQLTIDISTEVGGVIEQTIDNSITNYFIENPIDIDVDFTPLMIRFDIVDAAIAALDLDVDLEPIITRIQEAEDKIITDLGLRFDDVDKDLDCIISSIDGSYVLFQTPVVATHTSTHDQNVFVIGGFGNSARYASVEIIDFNPSAVRTYKFTGSAAEVEAGFGHVSRLLFSSIIDFQLMSTKSLVLDLTYVPAGTSPMIRVSFKPGVTFRVRAYRYQFIPWSCD